MVLLCISGRGERGAGARAPIHAASRRVCERHLPIWAFWLAGTIDLPVAAEFADWQVMLPGDGQGAKPLAGFAVETNSRLWECVPGAAFAGLKRLNPGRVEERNSLADLRIERGQSNSDRFTPIRKGR